MIEIIGHPSVANDRDPHADITECKVILNGSDAASLCKVTLFLPCNFRPRLGTAVEWTTEKGQVNL